MEIDDSDNGNSDYSTSEEMAFDLPQYGLSGLRIYCGFRREKSIDGPDNHMHRQEWSTVSDEENARSLTRRGFIQQNHPEAIPVGQAIDLSLRMMESPRSVGIMARVAKRLVDASPRDILHITPQSTQEEVESLVKRWLVKLRYEEFFKIQFVDPKKDGDGRPCDYWTQHRAWGRYADFDNPRPELRKWHPHNAGMLVLNEELVDMLVWHSRSGLPHSRSEHQKCLFYLASLITKGVQGFWIHFLMPSMSHRGQEDPEVVHSTATRGIVTADQFHVPTPCAGRHWEVEFLGGALTMHYLKRTADLKFDVDNVFGRKLSVGTPMLLRTDKTSQHINMESIFRLLRFDFSEGHLATYGDRVNLLDQNVGPMSQYEECFRG
ncbi:hypothetical protein Daus18300_002506 [Diaporthe australafricana]|uniref:Uncharacterized protein n=1 Tax=Diaporthe australafricana TaxID=127596 RepID=A0ABR3XNL0_9PEZI